MVKRVNFTYFPFILNFTLSFIFLGLIELVRAKFNINNIFSSQYVFNVAVPSVINYSIMINAIFMYKVYLLHNNAQIKKKQSKIDDIVDNDVDGADFDKFMFEESMQKKIKAYKKHIRKQIRKLEKKASHDDIMIFVSDDKELQRNNKYSIKRMQLEKLINNEENINKNIFYVDVKYKPVKRSQFINNYKSKKEDDDFEDVNLDALKETFPYWLFSFTLTAFIYSFTLDKQEFALITLLYYLIRIITATFSFFAGRNYMLDSGLKKMLKNLDTIYLKLKKYLAWRVHNKKEVKALETNQLQN